MKRFFWVSIAVLAAWVISAIITPAAADTGTATNLFHGTATTGAGRALPVDINPGDIVVRDDGAIGLGYIYRAEGRASGNLEGPFNYEEHGYLFFRDPADPTTFAGSVYVSGVFTLRPYTGGPIVTIADTCPSCYTSGVKTVRVSDLPRDVLMVIRRLSKEYSRLRKNQSITYGHFTFTNAHGTFTGYATPDFRRFGITITFDVTR
jgi:hypothetical protein